jgi:hypothetical protein
MVSAARKEPVVDDNRPEPGIDALLESLMQCDDCRGGPCLFLETCECGDTLCCICNGRDALSGEACHHCLTRLTEAERSIAQKAGGIPPPSLVLHPAARAYLDDVDDLASSVPGGDGPALVTWIGPDAAEARRIARWLRSHIRRNGYPIEIRQRDRIVCAWRVELGARASRLLRKLALVARAAR